MRTQITKSRCPSIVMGLAALVLTGCSSTTITPAKGEGYSANSGDRATNSKLETSLAEQQLLARRRFVDDLLAQPLTSDAAAQLALLNGPALQTAPVQKHADTTPPNTTQLNTNQAAQPGRLSDPKSALERPRRSGESEIGRSLANQPDSSQRAAIAIEQLEQTQQAWVRAVAAKQSLLHAGQVKRSAEASAELARRMQQVGNFSKLQRARQQAFYADATSQLAAWQHFAVATREELVRQLGLSAAQAGQLQLPERLPDLPAQARAASIVSDYALEQRLDLQVARATLEQAGRAQGLNLVNSLIDDARGTRSETRSGIWLPAFDWGASRREAMNEQSLAAAQYYDSTVHRAASQLRQSYSAYRTAYDVARHHQGEILPLHKLMADENLLLYNGMLISVFDLLAGLRQQVASVTAAIGAAEQFWLADAALAAAIAGKPTTAESGPAPVRSDGAAVTHSH